jgi:hypothetical protein
MAHRHVLHTGNSRERAEAEHGVPLPSSAKAFQCRGNAWAWTPDRGASTVFEMEATDLPLLISQLKVRPGPPTFIPGNDDYRGFRFPWTAAAPLSTYSCASPTGDWLQVQIWPLDDKRVGVWMYTDWN